MNKIESHTWPSFCRISLTWAAPIPFKNFNNHPGCMASEDETNKAICIQGSSEIEASVITK